MSEENSKATKRVSRKVTIPKRVRKSAETAKRVRQAEDARKHNASRRSMMNTYIKKVRIATDISKEKVPDSAEAWSVYRKAQALLDRFATKKLIHKNKAARVKIELVKRLKKLESKSEA